MPDELLQNHYCVASLQPRLSYNVIMTLPSDGQSDEMVATEGRRRPRLSRAGFVAAALLSSAVLVAACGGGPAGLGVASVGKATTTTGPSRGPSGGRANPSGAALAFAQCMRAHGDASMADPVVSGHSVRINVDPNAPHFTAAYNACRHLLANKGVPRNTITPAEQADYLKAAACMRSHGIPNFPDPTFFYGGVSFQNRSPIDTGSPQYKRAVATCQKLIPRGLPYSGTYGS